MKKLTQTVICLIVMISTGCQSYVLSSENAKVTQYLCVSKPGIILFDVPSDRRNRCAYLLIDRTGKPAVYPSPRRDNRSGRLTMLSNLSEEQVKLLWKVTTPKKGFLEAKFVGWSGGKWHTFCLELRFENDRCNAFRVTGPDIFTKDFISTEEISERIISSKSSIPILPEILCVEGPRDTSDCRLFIDP